MAILPAALKEKFMAEHPAANVHTLESAVMSAGTINQGIEQLRSLYARDLLEGGGKEGEEKVRAVFPKEADRLIAEFKSSDKRPGDHL